MLLSTAFATVSCQEFLSEQLPQGTLSEEQALDSKNTEKMIVSAYAGLTTIEDINASFSLWNYDVREGRYTLTRYYNYKQFHLGKANPEMDSASQWWQTCEEWVLTDFSLADDGIAGDMIQVRPQTLLGAFGASDYDASYWGKFNSIVVDKLPLQMLREKLQILIDKKKLQILIDKKKE